MYEILSGNYERQSFKYTGCTQRRYLYRKSVFLVKHETNTTAIKLTRYRQQQHKRHLNIFS